MSNVVVQKSTMPKGWEEVKLGDICDIFSGGTPKTGEPKFWNGDIPWLAPPDFTSAIHWVSQSKKSITELGLKNSATRLLQYGDVIISARGTVGALAQIKKPMAFSQTNYGLRANPKIADAIFFFYAVKNSIKEIKQFTYGAVFDTITTKTFDDIHVFLPPIIEQKAIAELLSNLDDKIDLLYRQNKTLESMAQTLFHKWFVDNPNRVNWEEIKLADIYDFIKGFEPGSKCYKDIKSDDTIRFIRVGDMLNNREGVYISKDYTEKICEKTDLLVSFDGTVGRLVFGIEGAYSSGIRKIVSKKESYNNLGFKYLLFNSTNIQNMIQQHAKGTVILHASSAIDFLSFQLPDEKELAKFNNMIIPIFDKTSHNQNKIRTLEKTRDLLFPKLMSGKARVKEFIGK